MPQFSRGMEKGRETKKEYDEDEDEEEDQYLYILLTSFSPSSCLIIGHANQIPWSLLP